MMTGHGPFAVAQQRNASTNGQDAPPGRGAPRGRRAPWLRVAAAAAVAAAGAWAWWANWGPAVKPSMEMTARVQAGGAIPVLLADVTRGAISGTVTYTGSVAAFNEEDIYPRVTGRIVEMFVYPGDAVRAGQTVARLDDVELSWRLREAEAMLRSATANRAQMEADLLAARHNIAQMERELAMVEAELSYAQAVAVRAERLIASGSISRQEYENDATLARAQAAKRDAARAKVDQAQAMEVAARRKLEVGDAMLAQGEANLRAASVVHGYVTIAAPSAGWVVKRLIAPGVLVQPGMAILKTAQIDRVRLQANVGERDLPAIKVGTLVRVWRSHDGSENAVNARVTSVAPFADAGSRTTVVEAIVPNAERQFLPGQYLAMEFTTGSRNNVLTVPRAAVARLGGRATVWVVTDGAAAPRDVLLGLENADRVEVASGLAPSDRVVARGHENLYVGARVTPVAPAAADTPAATRPAAPVPMLAPAREIPHATH